MIHHIARHSTAPVVAVATSPPVLLVVASAVGITAAAAVVATSGTYVGARLAGKTHKEAKKNLGKNTLDTCRIIKECIDIIQVTENAYHLAESTTSEFNK
ncbi:MAG TPA: hypothetical protein V6D28_18675 [Leptolyngbyaceae cyanobacterium]